MRYTLENNYMFVLRSVPCSRIPFSISTCTYVTVPHDVYIDLIILYLSLSSICIFIYLTHVYVYLNNYTHLPPLPYLYTPITIFICMYV